MEKVDVQDKDVLVDLLAIFSRFCLQLHMEITTFSDPTAGLRKLSTSRRTLSHSILTFCQQMTTGRCWVDRSFTPIGLTV